MPSYSPVYSQAFILNTDAAPNTEFEVPSGYTAVIRQITITVETGVAYFEVRIANSLIAPYVAIAIWGAPVNLATQSFQGRWVVAGGGIITLYQDILGVGGGTYVGGYLLRNTLS